VKTKIKQLLLALALLTSLFQPVAATGANTAFTYQGQLSDLDHGSNTFYLADMTFTLFTTSAGGSPVSGPITNSSIIINLTSTNKGIFSTMIDFGASPFTGTTPNWLEIGVRSNGLGAFTIMTPRQLITPTPQSIYALNAAIATSASNFSGSVSGDVSGPQGATAVLSVGGQPAANIASGVIAANAATSANTPGTIVARDGSGGFSAGSVTLGGSLYLPSPAIIYSGSNIMTIETGSYYAGAGAGNADFTRLGWPAVPDLLNVGVGDGVLNSDNAGSRNTAIGQQALQLNTTGSNNTAGGYQSLQHNTTGFNNKADGYQALNANTTGYDNTANGSQSLYSNIAGTANTAEGYLALFSNLTGNNNTANGVRAMFANTSGYNNTAIGENALFSNTTGYQNTANGMDALYTNTTGFFNTANGFQALFSNTTGSSNTASGVQSLFNNTIGYWNIANGPQALYKNTSGYHNVANGTFSLHENTTGFYNAANGGSALYSNTTGDYNTADGANALWSNTTGNDNTANGDQALYNNTGINNIGVGFGAGQNLTTGNNNIDIGNQGVAGESDTIRIGTIPNTSSNGPAYTFIAGIYDSTVVGGAPV